MSCPIRIVIADDHPLFREGVAHSLATDASFAVVAQAGSGEEAVAAAASLRPDLVMLDITMPGIGGIEAVRRISVDNPGTRIIVLTVAEDQDSLLAALKAGAHGYLLKGIAAAELRNIVRHVAQGEAYVTPMLAADLLTEFARPRGGTPDPFYDLTGREIEVLEQLREGLSNREIGTRLHLAEKTIKHHISNILQKLHVRSRTEAALLAMRRGRGHRRS